MRMDPTAQTEDGTVPKGTASTARMRAVVRDSYGPPEVLRIASVDKPVPGEGEVLVRVVATSVNTADLDHLLGVPSVARIAYGLRRPRNRRVGLDMAGVVEEVGEGVRALKPGEEVWADLFTEGQGAYAEYVCAPEGVFTAKPKSLTFDEAAAVPHSGLLALQALNKLGPIRTGQKILINGAGGCVGPFAIQLARLEGAEVTGVDHTGKLDFMRSLGADHVIDYTEVDVTKTGERYDLILDIAANRSVRHYRRVLSPRGRYVQIGRDLAGFIEAFLVGGLISLLGSKHLGLFAWAPNDKNDKEYLRVLLDAGDIAPPIDRGYGLSEIADALRYVHEGHARGKVAISIGSADR